MADIIARCKARGLRLTEQRRVLARVIGDAGGDPRVAGPSAGRDHHDHLMDVATGHRLALLAVSLRK